MLKVSSSRGIWVGRDREMAEIEAGLDDLMQGRGSLFLVTGEPGIGKTRFADEAGRRAAARGASVHWGRAWEAGGAPSYWPFIQALRTMSRDAKAVDALVAPSLSPVERFQLFEAVDSFLRAATPPPRVMVLDDLHAADPSSLQLLDFIVRELRSRPLMVIGTYRDAEARLSETRPLLARMAREACVLPLRRLDRGDVATFVARATGSEPAGDRVDQLLQKTEGNPLFLWELLRVQGARPLGSEGIREVVRQRLALVPRESFDVLEAASVLGREFAPRQLAAVAGCSELEARALVEPATDAGVVETLDDPPRWRFTHVLLREGLYESLAGERRAALHRSAAIEARGRAGGPPVAELAHHLVRAIPAVPAGEAADAALRAADHAMGVLAFEDALDLYASAEKLLAAGDDRALFEAILGVGHAHMRMANVDVGRRACGRAAELARRLGDGEAFARAVLAAGYEHVPEAHDPGRIADLEDALAMLPPGDGALRAACMAQLACDRVPSPDLRPRVELARDAVAMARRVADAGTLRAALSAASLVTAVHVDPSERMVLLQETLRLALAAGDKRIALRAHAFLAGSFWELGDPAGARSHSLAVDSLVREFRHGRFRWLSSVGHAFEALSEGRFEEARRWYDDAQASVERDEARGALLAAAPISIACIMERYEDVAGLESRARSRFGAMGHSFGACTGELLIAQLYGRAGDARRAAVQLEACAAHPLFDAIAEASWLSMLADACHLASDATLADRLYQALLPRAERFVFLGPLTACVDLPYARHLGLLAETLGRADDAVAHLTDGVARASRAGMRAHLSRMRYELARALLARGGPGDRDRARELIREAQALATELRQTGLLPRIAALGFEGDDPPVRAASAGPMRFSLRLEGDVWSVEWEGRTVRLRDSRGLALLANLVENAGQELHVLQLVSAGDAPRDAGDAGPALDAKAVQRYRRRLLDLRDELSEAEAFADTARAERARAEMDHLGSELARAVGLGGRERRTGHAAERARTAVQKRLREAVRRIEAELPELGRHLDRSIRTGVFCGYLPDGRRR